MDFAMKTPPGQLDPKKLQFPTRLQPKLDGLRGIFVRTLRGDEWFSYSGKPLWNLEHVTGEMPCVTGTYDGEIIWPGHPFADAYGLCKRQKPDPKKYPDHAQSKTELQYHVFDMLTPGEWDDKFCSRVFDDRMKRLIAAMGDGTERTKRVPIWTANTTEAFLQYHKMFLETGYEGTMVKNPDGLYHWKRHPDWQRYKPTQTIDVMITGYIEGKGKWKGALGAFWVKMPDGTECKSGGGRIDLATRKDWWERRQSLLGTYVEVESKLTTKAGKMREPILIRLREDKS
jgi:ATP-dependent DNA ligase